MTLRPLIPALFATAALATLALTGCSTGALPGSIGTSAAPAGDASAAPTSSPASPPPAASGSASCPSSSEVGSTLGIPAPPAPQKASLDGAVSCVYLSSSSNSVTIETIPAHGAAATKLNEEFTQGTVLGTTFTPVSGIGDSAYSMTRADAISGLYVISGDKVLSIAATGVALDKLEGLASKILGL